MRTEQHTTLLPVRPQHLFAGHEERPGLETAATKPRGWHEQEGIPGDFRFGNNSTGDQDTTTNSEH